jgi:hypothetical protein
LNFCLANGFPERFGPTIANITKSYKLNLRLAVTPDERRILIEASKAKALSDFTRVLNTIPTSMEDNYMFLRLAMTKFIALWSTSLLCQPHREGWYRSNVYADTFDPVIMFDGAIYETKSAECHASVIKSLKKIKKLKN